MHKTIVVRDQLDAQADQPILQPLNGPLITGNLARGKHHRVAFGQADMMVAAIGDARQSRARLTLAAGADKGAMARR